MTNISVWQANGRLLIQECPCFVELEGWSHGLQNTNRMYRM